MAKNYVDLGLPSGTLYDYNEAVEEFGDRLPTKDDWQELIDHVPHSFEEKRAGLVFTARNGNKLFLPITSFCNGKDYAVEYIGLYISATPCNSNSVYCLHFDKHKARVRGRVSRNESFYVKLIKRGE